MSTLKNDYARRDWNGDLVYFCESVGENMEKQVAQVSDVVRRFLLNVNHVPDGTDYLECRYHYTTANVLEKFLSEDGDFYCTHYRALNDDSEFREGFRRVIQYARKKGWNNNLIDRLEKLGNHFNEHDIFMPWVFSFSLYNDMLSQWIGYTNQKTGGYAIGFDMKQLDRLIKARKTITGKQPVKLVVNCIYADVDDVDVELDKVFGELRLCSYVYSSQLDIIVEAKLISGVIMMSAMIKEKSFFQEAETRLCLLIDDEIFYHDVISLDGKPRMKANLCERPGYLRDLIKSVVISPHGNQDSLYANALSLKRKYALDYFIVKSTSHYKG